MKQKELSLWLKAIVIVFFVFVLILCVFIIPSIGKDIKAQVPELAYMYPICLGFIWVSAVPFFIALLLVWKICTDIGENNAFTNNTSKRLRIIGTLAFSEVIYYMIGIMALVVFKLGHPSVLLGGCLITLIGLFIAVTASILSHLIEKAVKLQQENDLTV